MTNGAAAKPDAPPTFSIHSTVLLVTYTVSKSASPSTSDSRTRAADIADVETTTCVRTLSVTAVGAAVTVPHTSGESAAAPIRSVPANEYVDVTVERKDTCTTSVEPTGPRSTSASASGVARPPSPHISNSSAPATSVTSSAPGQGTENDEKPSVTTWPTLSAVTGTLTVHPHGGGVDASAGNTNAKASPWRDSTGGAVHGGVDDATATKPFMPMERSEWKRRSEATMTTASQRS
jgi:hypothetical protein